VTRTARGTLPVMTGALLTADRVRLDAHHDPGPTGLGVVVAHGLTGSWRRPGIRRAAAALARVGGVVSFDFRGHGRSGGRSTVGDLEVLDLAAAVAWARELGYRRIATVGFSMGAAVALRYAAGCAPVAAGPGADLPPADGGSAVAGPVGAASAGGGGAAGPLSPVGDRAAGDGAGLAAVVAISGPSRWYYRGTPAMRRVHWVIEKRTGRLAGRVLRRTRIAATGWDPVPEPPDVAAARIAPTPLLVVHGDADPLFPVEHAHALYAAAREPKQLWIEPGFGHAENAAPAALLARVAAWLAATADPGRAGRDDGGTPDRAGHGGGGSSDPAGRS
jgi:pimeloyl-ACP methyl ester carboxylesterase